MKILTSGFDKEFPTKLASKFNEIIINNNLFVFVASDFNNAVNTDKYFNNILSMFCKSGIIFQRSVVIDNRMKTYDAEKMIKSADVIWLAGGDSPKQYASIKNMNLDLALQNCTAVLIGMSAGSINMAKISVCTVTSGHDKQSVYSGLGLVNISVEPHFDKNNISKELLDLSQHHHLIGVCDNAAIICSNDNYEIIGDVYSIKDGVIKSIKTI